MMKYLILSIYVVSSFSFVSNAAEVVQHSQEFALDQVDDGKVHYWGKMMSWNKWVESGHQNLVSIDKNPIYTTILNGENEFEVNPPNLVETQTVLGDQIGQNFYDSISSREELDRAEVQEKSAVIYKSKIGVKIPVSIDKARIDISTLVDIFSKADSPHVHTSVSKDFAHSILEPLHSSHRVIDGIDENAELIFSTIRFEDYGCDPFMNMLAAKAEAQDENIERIIREDGREVPVFRTYSLSVLRRLPQSERNSLESIFGRVPDEVYAQELLYSSSILRDGVNYWGLFSEDDGTTTLVNYSAMAFTTKVSSVYKAFLDGITVFSDSKLDVGASLAIEKLSRLSSSLGGIRKPVVDMSDFVIDDSWVDLSHNNTGVRRMERGQTQEYDHRVCTEGLGIGMPRYTIKNLNNFARGLSEL